MLARLKKENTGSFSLTLATNAGVKNARKRLEITRDNIMPKRKQEMKFSERLKEYWKVKRLFEAQDTEKNKTKRERKKLEIK